MKEAVDEDPVLLAVRYADKKELNIIGNCGSTVEGMPRTTRKEPKIPRPKVMAEYYSIAGSIDKYNHCRTGEQQ